jgi:uncharacterized integral membrane protein
VTNSADPPNYPPAPTPPSASDGEPAATTPVAGSRTSAVWIGLIVTALFLLLLIIFIAQNTRQVTIHFFGWQGHFPLALAILLSAVVGALLVAIPGSVRILQLRRAARHR